MNGSADDGLRCVLVTADLRPAPHAQWSDSSASSGAELARAGIARGGHDAA